MKTESFLKIFGFLYLIYLAYKTYTSTKRSVNNEAYSSFKSGFLFQILNMKSLLFFITLLGAFIIPIADMKIATYIYDYNGYYRLGLFNYLGCFRILSKRVS
ncbi:LysE family translocator [Staphylococcus equorum]|uniref:LysE family translocator n=1 Tax=Staphylococcus equorum TaxID=246432 RepID=UPI0034E38C78